MTIVEVEWWDARSFGGWSSPAEYAKKGIALCRTVGYLLRRNKREIVVVQNVGDTTGNVSDATAIPTCCVKRVRRLKR